MFDLPRKMKAIRAKEGLTQAQFCELVGISISSWKKYEASIIDMGLKPFLKVANHPRFKKYALWLIATDSDDFYCEQVSPVQS
ncbi:helix-turn-helix transcriptional regulator [Pseudomonas cichorii]|nr:helix-turn-helix transcriptional regulator [Pseudomonas cichorii]